MIGPHPEITPETLLRAYTVGIFPMASARDDPEIHWVDPRRRGIIPLDGFRVSRSLARAIGRGDYEIRVNSDFRGTVEGCAEREETWINASILRLYLALHEAGHAHSLEVWADGRMVGGVYGVAIGAVFFGESMFSRRRDASKIALAWLVHRLSAGGYRLFDTQFLTPHLASLGGIEIARGEFHVRLRGALAMRATFEPPGYAAYPSLISGRSSVGVISGSTSGATKPESQDSTQMSKR